ncbi:MAG: DNA polymerase III subunit chi, partial [Spongiibacteraceae bacterium]
MSTSNISAPQIDFYISPAATLEQRLLLACRLADKAYRSGHRVYLHCSDDAQAQQLDVLLWQFQPSSFVPHLLTNADEPFTDEKAAPVQIGSGKKIWDNGDVLINLDNTVPDNFANYVRVLEVVVQDAAILDITRQHWRH